ncbi:MAG: glycosylhydrolase-like jelly roll fold domain-containing protein [Sedimentisphaerales bacterium]
MMEINEILEPGLFWFWNQTPSIGEIGSQLDEFLSKGIRSLYIHPMPQTFRQQDFLEGMDIEYLSDQYFELVAETCKQMRSRRMFLWLYDEGGWPSGTANGMVIKTDKKFGIWTLCMHDGVAKPQQHWSQCLYPDLMNIEATECFIRSTHEKYYKWIGQEFGRTVKGIFTDEPRLLGRIGTEAIPWSPCLSVAFESDHDYPFESILKHLFTVASNGETLTYQRAYLQTISKMIAENYYKPIRQWCDRHNLFFEGHLSGESEFSKHGFCFGDYFQQAKYFHIPGIDAINRQIFPDIKSGNFALLASSVKWLDGKSAASSECGNVYGAGLTFSQMKWIAAYQIVRGIDRINFMPALYSTSGARRISTCSDFSFRNHQMRNFDVLTSFIKKTLQFCNSELPLIRVGVFYRSEMINDDVEAMQFNVAHEQLLENLLNQQAGVVIIDLEHLKQGKVLNGELVLTSMRLAVLIVHMASLPEQEEYEVFNRLLRDGVNILYVGSESQWQVFRDNIHLPDSLALKWVTDVNHARVDDLSFIKLSEKIDGVRILTWQNGDGHKLLVFNQNMTEIAVLFRIPVLGENIELTEIAIENAPHNIYHPLTVIDGEYKLHLYASEVRAFQTTRNDRTKTQKFMFTAKRPVEQKWKIFQEESLKITDDIKVDASLSPAVINELGDYSSQNASFSGTLQYTTTFDWEVEKYNKVFLDIGKVYYSAEVIVNNVSCGRRAWEPFVFDITDAIHRGINHINVHVTNTLANQWADPLVRSADFEKYRNSYLEATRTYIDESCHSGLCGPVQIIICSYNQ